MYAAGDPESALQAALTRGLGRDAMGALTHSKEFSSAVANNIVATLQSYCRALSHEILEQSAKVARYSFDVVTHMAKHYDLWIQWPFSIVMCRTDQHNASFLVGFESGYIIRSQSRTSWELKEGVIPRAVDESDPFRSCFVGQLELRGLQALQFTVDTLFLADVLKNHTVPVDLTSPKELNTFCGGIKENMPWWNNFAVYTNKDNSMLVTAVGLQLIGTPSARTSQSNPVTLLTPYGQVGLHVTVGTLLKVLTGEIPMGLKTLLTGTKLDLVGERIPASQASWSSPIFRTAIARKLLQRESDVAFERT